MTSLGAMLSPSASSRRTLYVTGDVDVVTTPQLRFHLRRAVAAGDGELVVDLSGVPFMDCTGLGALMEAREAMGGRILLRRPPWSLMRILGLCDLVHLFGLAGPEPARPVHDDGPALASPPGRPRLLLVHPDD